jgi:hypothetical protein
LLVPHRQLHDLTYSLAVKNRAGLILFGLLVGEPFSIWFRPSIRKKAQEMEADIDLFPPHPRTGLRATGGG